MTQSKGEFIRLLVIDAGTYNVLASCAAGTAAGVFERGNLIVWAVPVEDD